MKATVSSYCRDKIYLLVTEVDRPGEMLVVGTNGPDRLTILTNPIALTGSMALTLNWAVADILKNKIRLLYRHDNMEELVDIDLSEVVGTILPMQAGMDKPRPEKIERIAALTICYNEDLIIRKWAEYYGRVFGYENLFIIDDGSDTPVSTVLAGLPVNITRIPRTTFDSWRLVRTLAYMQRVLLETYDLVLTADSDEFMTCNSHDPALDLKTYLMSQDPENYINVAPVGFDMVHDRAKEPPLDLSRPIAAQRNYVRRSQGFDKPVLSTVPTSFYPGLHQSYFPKRVDTNITLLHFRVFDYDFAINKLMRYNNTQWSENDLKTGLAFHQRWKVEELDKAFTKITSDVDAIDPAKPMLALAEGEAGLLDRIVADKVGI